MKKLAVYSLPALVCLVAVIALMRPSPRTAQDDEPLVASEPEVPSRRSTYEERTITAPPVAPVPKARAAAPVPAASSSSPHTDTAASTASALRRPVIEAIRTPGLSGAQKRKVMLEAIRSSGESDEAWTAEAEVAFENWAEAMPTEVSGGFSVEEPHCYAAGCVADVTFANPEAYRAAAKAFRALAETGIGHGGRVQTPFESQGERVVASWIMLRPQDI